MTKKKTDAEKAATAKARAKLLADKAKAKAKADKAAAKAMKPIPAPKVKAPPTPKAQKVAKPKVEAPKQIVNHFHLFLDESGSMAPFRYKAVETFNANVQAIRSGEASSGQASTISLTTFGRSIRTRFFCDPVSGIAPLNSRDYTPDGGTPLFDAVGLQIEKMLALKYSDNEDVSFVFIIITDGEENGSQKFSARELNELIAKVQKTDRWSFAFLLPRGMKSAFCRNFNVPDGNVREWDVSERGLEDAAKSVSAGVDSYYTGRSAGIRSSTGFFTTNMANVSKAAVTRQLVNVRDRVRVGDVNASVEIRAFVESNMLIPYAPGRAYYQLQKTEEVQHHKQVMLRSRLTGDIYAGADARHILGLPDNLDIKVKPGDHGEWDIFVQSTSTNRKLVPGTRLLYLP